MKQLLTLVGLALILFGFYGLVNGLPVAFWWWPGDGGGSTPSGKFGQTTSAVSLIAGLGILFFVYRKRFGM